MEAKQILHKSTLIYGFVSMILVLSACSSSPSLAPSSYPSSDQPVYIIGAGDTVNIFVWGNASLSTTVPVRPDGRLTTPLVEDVQASGKTPSQLAREIEKQLANFVKNPIVSVTVTDFVGNVDMQIRVVGQAAQPQSIPYRKQLTALDVMIAAGGLTEFASGNEATLIRKGKDGLQRFRVRLDDLLNDGDISANIDMLPGDILIIPEAWF